MGQNALNAGMGSGGYISETQLNYFLTEMLMSWPDLFSEVKVPNEESDRAKKTRAF